MKQVRVLGMTLNQILLLNVVVWTIVFLLADYTGEIGPYTPWARSWKTKKDEEERRKDMIRERHRIINVYGITKEMHDRMGEQAVQNGLIWDSFEGVALNPSTRQVDHAFMQMYVQNQLEPFYQLAENATDARYYYDGKRVRDQLNGMEVAWDWYEDQGRRFMG